MKYNKEYGIPEHLFIEHYEIVGDKIIIYHANGIQNEVDYSIECEKKILNTIYEQLENAKGVVKDLEYNKIDPVFDGRNESGQLLMIVVPLLLLLCAVVFPGLITLLLFLGYMGPVIIAKKIRHHKRYTRYHNVANEMEKTDYIIEHLDDLKNYDDRLSLMVQKKDIKSSGKPKQSDEKVFQPHVVNSLEIYSLESLRAVIESWEAQKLYINEDVEVLKKNAPELVLEEQKVKKLGQKK